MPSIVGNIKVNTVGSAGILNIGDTFYKSPKSTNKAFSGSGSFTTGDFQVLNNLFSSTNTFEPHVLDSNIKST